MLRMAELLIIIDVDSTNQSVWAMMKRVIVALLLNLSNLLSYIYD
jgi:hypothetical protein